MKRKLIFLISLNDTALQLVFLPHFSNFIGNFRIFSIDQLLRNSFQKILIIIILALLVMNEDVVISKPLLYNLDLEKRVSRRTIKMVLD